MQRLTRLFAAWLKRRSPRTQHIILRLAFGTLMLLAFILSLSAEQRIIAP